jgi:hypothetical protein
MRVLKAAAAHNTAKNASMNSNRDQALISMCMTDSPYYFSPSIGAHHAGTSINTLARIAKDARAEEALIASAIGGQRISTIPMESQRSSSVPLARIIRECRREAAETEVPPRLLASEGDAGVLAVRRGARTRKAAPGERIGRCNRYS